MASGVRFSITRSGDGEYDSFQLHQETTYEGETVETTFDLGFISSGEITWDQLFSEYHLPANGLRGSSGTESDSEGIIWESDDVDKKLEYSIVVSRNKGKTTYIFKCESTVSGTIYRISIPISNPADSFTYELQKLMF
jgi:hypothetical protein